MSSVKPIGDIGDDTEERARRARLLASPTTAISTRTVTTVREPLTGPEWRDFYSQLKGFVSETQAPGFGAHSGTLVGGVEEIPLAIIAPNPQHPRDDWQYDDEAMRLLRSSIGTRKVQPVLLTPLLPNDPLIQEGYQLLMVKGHRRLRAAGLERLETIQAQVVLDESNQPLDRLSQLMYWLTGSVCQKAPTLDQLLVAFASIRAEFDRVKLANTASRIIFPEQPVLAARLGVSVRSIQRLMRITSEPPEIVRAVASRLISRKAIETILESVEDAQQRVRLVEEAITSSPHHPVNVRLVQELLGEGPPPRLELMPPLHYVASSVAAALLEAVRRYESLPEEEHAKLPATIVRVIERLSEEPLSAQLRALAQA